MVRALTKDQKILQQQTKEFLHCALISADPDVTNLVLSEVAEAINLDVLVPTMEMANQICALTDASSIDSTLLVLRKLNAAGPKTATITDYITTAILSKRDLPDSDFIKMLEQSIYQAHGLRLPPIYKLGMDECDKRIAAARGRNDGVDLEGRKAALTTLFVSSLQKSFDTAIASAVHAKTERAAIQIHHMDCCVKAPSPV